MAQLTDEQVQEMTRTGSKFFSGSTFCNWHNNAIQRGHRWTLTQEDIDDLWEKQSGRCALSGMMMTTEAGSLMKVSLDRIDSHRGYDVDNVQFVGQAVNFMKQDYDEEQFVDFCQAIVIHKRGSIQ